MAAKKQAKLQAKDLRGFKYFKLLTPLLERLHDNGTARDKAGNRQLFFDQYGALLLLYFFNPILTSLRGIHQASTLDKVGQQLGVSRTSLGSLSEAARVLDAAALQEIIDAHSSFIGRLRDNAVWHVVAERPLSAAARAAGVVSDRVVWLGGDQSGAVFKQPLRVLEVRTGKKDDQGRPEVLLLATD